jgi:predicted esterase
MMIAKILHVLIMADLCSGKDAKDADPAPQKFDFNGKSREYWVYVPPAGTPPTGLIIGLHGAGMSGLAQCEWTLRASDLVKTIGAVVVCPTSTTEGTNPGKRRLKTFDGQPEDSSIMLQKEGWTQMENGTWYNSETGEMYHDDKGGKDDKEDEDKKDNENLWKAWASLDDAEDVNFLAALISHSKETYNIPSGRVVMNAFSNGVSMAYRFHCEKPEVIDGLVLEGYVWQDPWNPYNQSKPPYLQCAAANFTKKPAFYTVCGTDDAYCNALGYQEEWEMFSTGVLGCTGASKEVGSFPDFPAGAKTCRGYDSCPGMNTACRVSGHGHSGQIGADAVHHAFASFFNMTLEPLPPAPKKAYPGKEEKTQGDDGKDKMKGDKGDKMKGDEKDVTKSKDDSVQSTTSSASTTEAAGDSASAASSAFVALLSSTSLTVVCVVSVAAVLG